MMAYSTTDTQLMIRRTVLLAVAVSLIYRFIAVSYPHQMEEPLLTSPGLDLFYWFWILTGMAELMTATVYGYIHMAALWILLIIAWFRPFQGIWFGLIALFFLTFMVNYNLYSGHHTHCAWGIFLATLALAATRPVAFGISWSALRLYACYLYGSAFLWKLFRGSLWHSEQARTVLEVNLAHYMHLHPDTLLTQVYEFLLVYSIVLFLLYCLAMAIECVFLAGFFTRRWDGILFFVPILLHSGTYFMADVMFFEMLVLNLAFIPARYWASAAKKIDQLNTLLHAKANHTSG